VASAPGRQSIRSVGVQRHRGWHLKRYVVTPPDVLLDGSALSTMHRVLGDLEPAPATGGVGFVILHQRGRILELLVALWQRDTLQQTTYRCAADGTLQLASPVGGPGTPAWEPVLAHERDVFAAHMLRSSPRVSRYLADDLPGTVSGWLPEAAELEAYEGMRQGDEQAFRLLAEPLQPTLRRLAGLYVESEETVAAVVLHTWEVALGGLDMFRWSTPLATWIAAITVAFGRAHDQRTAPTPPRRSADAPVAPSPGPPDWSDLPWAARWEQAPANLADALAALPRAQREVLHGRDLEQWPPRRVCDVFGLTGSGYEHLLTDAHERLRDALAVVVGEIGSNAHRQTQIAAITGWLHLRLDPRPEQLDPRSTRVFRRWRSTRHRGLRRLSHHLHPTGITRRRVVGGV
jgi:DNA-directed RNA polymerase specialized sigma24 family protein